MRRIALCVLVGCSASPGPVARRIGPEPCTPSGITDDKTVIVAWSAIKNGTIPVDGTIEGRGNITPAASGGVKGTEVFLTFNPSTVSSGVKLRDDRISSIFFQNFVVTFSGTISGIDVDALPADGESRKVLITGTLAMAKSSAPVSVNGLLTNRSGNLTLSHDPIRPSGVNAKATQALRSNVESLLSVADVKSMDDRVEIKGTLGIVTNCGGPS